MYVDQELTDLLIVLLYAVRTAICCRFDEVFSSI